MPARTLVLVAYFLSGACSLVYEVVWTRYLSLTFGVTVFATSAVLASYMAGLGLGSFLVARRVDHHPNPVRIYAWLEIGIGLYALAVPFLFAALSPVYVAIAGRLGEHFLAFNVARALLAFVVLLVPTTLMGGTVPAIGRTLVSSVASLGWDVGLLYALNTFGAVAGCLGAGFVLMGSVGLSNTVAMTAALNVAIGTLLLVGRVGEGWTPPVAAAAGHAPRRRATTPAMRLATVVFAGSGFCALAYEVVWTRVLVIHVHNSTYAFSAMLAVVLVGLAAGDVLLMRRYDRIERPLFWLGVVQAGIGASVVVASLAYIPLRVIGGGTRGSWAAAVVIMFARAGLVLLPGALLSGMTFPLVARVVTAGLASVGQDLGAVYAANTLGGVFGSLAAGFLLVPLFGLRGTLLLLSGVNVALGAACWLASVRGPRRTALLAGAAALAVLPVLVIPRTIFSDALENTNQKLVYYHEGLTDTTGVWQMPDGGRIVTYGDMRGTAGTMTDPVNRVQGHLAHLLHPKPTKSLQICFGVGNTLAAAAMHPEVEQLDCVELSPNVRLTAPYFWTNDHVLDDPKVHLIIDDGRNYLLRTRERYDVITLEPPDIYTAGVVNLYTEEFYRLARNALADGGLLCQWLPIAEMTELEMRMLVRAFITVFPETTLWKEGTIFAAPLLLVGSKGPISIDPAAIARRMAPEAMHKDMSRLGIGTPDDLFSKLFLVGPEGTRRWVGDAPSVTDDRTVVDFTTPRSVYSGYGFGYFRVAGDTANQFNSHLWDVAKLYDRLREPITPLLRQGANP